MPSDRENALSQLKDALESEDGLLTSEQIEALLDDPDVRNWTPWLASTAYSVGDRVAPGNGRRYECVRAGVSGATAPAFPLSPPQTLSPAPGTVYDNTVQWRDDGSDGGTAYSWRRAARRGWIKKAALTSSRVNFSADGRSLSDHQTPEFCRKMAAMFDEPMVG